MARRVTMAKLIRHLTVEKVAGSDAVYLGRSVDLGWGRVYGGQTMAQGLAAAQHHAGNNRAVHSISCHFLRGGDVTKPIRFEVDELTNGRSFSALHVRALQDGMPILAMTAGFQTPEKCGIEHQIGKLKPEWKSPPELASTIEHMEPFLPSMPKSLRSMYTEEGSPFDSRPTEFVSPWDTTERPPSRAYWIKAKEAIPEDDPHIQARLLTYISDWGLLEPAVYPHPTAMWDKRMQMASLSHTLHFHQPFRLDQQWLCLSSHSPVAFGARSYCLGEIYREDGVLVASSAQEGLTRLRS